MSATAFPLQWPEGWPRTRASARERGWQFKQSNFRSGGRDLVTLEVARQKLFSELDRMGVGSVVLSSNVPLRLDGQPRNGASPLQDDPGVAIYFTLRGRQMAMACDRFDNPAANVRSLGLAIEAMRQLERHGGGHMMERAFSGFSALPPPRSCWEVLGIAPRSPRADIERAFRAMAFKAHPDQGGSTALMAELNTARETALREVG